MRILFISRAYPPVTGGIENQNYELSVWLPRNKQLTECRTIANRRGKRFLPLFLPWVTIKSLFLMRNYDALLLGDGVLGVTGYLMRLFYRKPAICVLHGLDLTYKNPIYQKLWVGRFIRSLDGLIAVSNTTKKIGIALGIPENKIFFIPNGVDTDKCRGERNRKRLSRLIESGLENKILILTYGRLVKRKGVAWFVGEVMPKLKDDIIYIIAGNGPEKDAVADAIRDNNLLERVFMLGYISEDTKKLLLGSADIFVQPNIPVEGDVEGFGISVIEAGAAGLPVIASSFEGLKDAIKDGSNGVLAEPKDASSFLEKINYMADNENYRKELGENAKKYVKDTFHWEIVASQYVERIKVIIGSKSNNLS